MFRDKERYGQDPTRVHRSSKATFDAPLKWQREAERGDRVGHNRLVFTCSWSDWFIEEADGAWRDDAWAIVNACPLLTFQILTKRIERAKDCFPSDWGAGYPNAWGGVSVENQAMAEERIPHLLCSPWSLRYLSVEPLLGRVDLTSLKLSPQCENEDMDGNVCGGQPLVNAFTRAERCDCTTEGAEPLAWHRIDWCIVGGESGNDAGKYLARPCDIAWIRSVVRQCHHADVPVWVKQLGSRPFSNNFNPILRMGGYLSLKDHHGGDWDEFPEDLRVRQMPETAHA